MFAYAKANLILSLGDIQESGRFKTHFLMQEIDLADTVEVELTDGDNITIECDDPKVPTDHRNLCHKAAMTIKELNQFHPRGGITIKIKKEIPSAGGLGGGSSDAAQVLLALNKLWDIQIPDDELIQKINSILGTDTSFFIKGGTAEVTKNGLNVEKIETNMELNFVFVLPDIKVPANKTAEVYKYFKLGKVKDPPDFKGLVESLKTNSLEGVCKRLYNAFEYSLPPHYKSIPNIKRDLVDAGCINAIMCGAGPTTFGVCKSKGEAKEAAKKLKGKYPMVFVANTRNQTPPHLASPQGGEE